VIEQTVERAVTPIAGAEVATQLAAVTSTDPTVTNAVSSALIGAHRLIVDPDVGSVPDGNVSVRTAIARSVLDTATAAGLDPAAVGIDVASLDQISLESASATACAMAQLPDIQPTPASRRIMEDLCLAARARQRLGSDERTARADLSVSVRDGRVTVTYMPAQARWAEAVPDVLAGLEGARELVSTMAVSNLLWIAETFDHDSTAFAEITDLAQRWGAAVELARLIPWSPDDEEPPPVDTSDEAAARQYIPKAHDLTGGIEEDVKGAAHRTSDGGLGATSEALIDNGLFGGSRVATGGAEQIAGIIKAQSTYSLVVVGDVFVSKGEASQVRLTRELCATLHDQTRVSVLAANELRRSFLFDKRQFLRLLASLAGVAAVYALVFTHQRPILEFLGGPAWKAWRPAATLSVLVTVPLVAYLYGTVSGLILSWLRFE